MTLSGQLEIAAHSLTAVLGLWLGLTVLTRSGTTATRVFSLLAISLAAWSSSIIVERLPTNDDARAVAHAIEELSAALALGATAHFALAIASHGLPTRRQLAVVAVAYATNMAFALPAVISPATPVALSPPYLEIGPLSGSTLGLAWVVVRLATLGGAIWWVLDAVRQTDARSFRRRQLRATFVTLLAGGFGASLRFLPGIGEADAWIGVSFVTLAIVLATYAVFSAGIFFGPAVAGRAFNKSILGGLVLFGIVVVIVVAESVSQAATGINVPLVTALVLVVAVAVYEPVSGRLRDTLLHDPARVRVLRAIGQPGLLARPAEAGVGPALDRLAGALHVDGLAVVGLDGRVIAEYGSGARDPTLEPIVLRADGQTLGEIRVGAASAGGALSRHDEELLRLSASYVAAALRASRSEAAQEASLIELAEERAAVERQATALHVALVEHDPAAERLRVYALGPMRVERAGQEMTRWGGDKAGTRQAQGLFGFLLDRGERGVEKDEVLELIWPDTDLDRADLAFHRTMVGLRRTLDPGGRGGRTSAAVRFRNDRYRLDPGVVAWSDVDTFLSLLDRARSEPPGPGRIGRLEEARVLYRGEYLDDCPFYGDSAHVEERRQHLRARMADLLVALGEAYESGGDRMSAVDAFRGALLIAADGCEPADAGLARLHA